MATKLKKKIGKGRHASTIKRDRQAQKNRARNKSALSKMKTSVKKVRASKDAADLKAAIRIIAKTAQKGMIHKKMASRLISRLTKAVNA